jgi:hypothetical protein
MDMAKKIQKAFPEDTLLRRFIIREIESYDLPERKGKRRGDLIGLALPTFVSAVLSGITNMQLNEIADLTGASYGALRHAVRGKRFQNVATGWQGAFSIFVAEYLTGKVKELRKAEKEGKDFIEEIAATPPIFNDAHLYREDTSRQICRVYFQGFTSAAALVACPREIFTRVVRIVFTHIDFARRIAERAFLDRVNEYILLNKVQFLKGDAPDPHFMSLLLLYTEGERDYHKAR